MTGGELTLGAILARLQVQEQQLAEQAATACEEIAELTALLGELDTAAEHIAITRKTLLELPEQDPSAPVPPRPGFDEDAAYQQILAVFTATDGEPLRAKQACEAMDLPLLPTNINNARGKLKRLAARRVLAETEPGLFAPPGP
ncbi:MAG: hypothetical protein JWQ60_4016 [Pseudonocardia sp.]|jgi:hypothetical protein|nr:hypothetical protein [Pseudonocardia sp.]